MTTHRAFYVTQDSLTVWQKGKAELRQVESFADNDHGLRSFDAYLAHHDRQSCFVVIDVIEEEFAPEAVPKLGMRDRAALMQRRLQRKFSRTPFRIPVYLGARSGQLGEATVVHSAITNHELLDPWLEIILRHEVSLTGVFSVPLMASALLKRLHKTQSPAMLLTQHQEHKLRQVFLQQGHTQSARLSQSPSISDAAYPQFVLTEVGRSRRYLERTRLLSSMQQLDVYIVAESSLAERILECAQSDTPLQIHFVKPEVAAKRVGIREKLEPDRLEALYLAMAFTRRPKHSYAVSGESRYWHMRLFRNALIGSAVILAAVCSALSGYYLGDAWLLRKQSDEIEVQLAQLTETFRRENERFDPIKADSSEMKLAVDTGDFILENRLPVAWVMQQVGLVMGDYPDIQIQSLGWAAESSAPAEPPRQRGDQPMPVPVTAISAVTADITADIVPFDGNMRHAFARIDALVADLQVRTAFGNIAVVEYPLDARPQSSLAGEIVGKDDNRTARFRLRLSYPLQSPTDADAGINNESV